MASEFLELLRSCGAITAAIQLTGFVFAFALNTEKFYDILGGVNFLVLGAYSASATDESSPWFQDERKRACTVIFFISRLWLLAFLAWRAHERGGDARFDEVKDKFGLFLVYWTVQGLWVFLISLPIIFVNSARSRQFDTISFSTLDWVSIVGFALGVIWEITADVQKTVWVKAGRPGVFCDVGVWQLSRHPNYFGEILQWWCAWLFACGSSKTGFANMEWWCTIISPLFTMQILLNMSGTGVAQSNGKNLKRYYERCPERYAIYRANTSILIPFVGYKFVPMFLKRTIFLDFERYEYRPSLKKD